MSSTLLVLSLIPLFFNAAPSFGLVDLPKSGQQGCFDEGGAIINCVGSGQDGDIQAGIEVPVPRFVDHGDGTVTDSLTGMMWLKDANCAATVGHDPAGTGTGQIPWLDALAFVAGINDGTFAVCQAGYTDWRLPNINEMLSTATFASLAPALTSGHPFLNVGGAWDYWSSTSNSGNGAWIVSFFFGLPSSRAKVFWDLYVWPVRGSSGARIALAKTGQTACYDENGDAVPCAASGQDGETQTGVAWPNPRFVDNGDGTIIDQLTGFMWQQDLNCAATVGYDSDATGDGRVSWQNALNFVAAVNAGTYPACAAGRSDWRLPNPIEFTSLVSPHDVDLPIWLTDNGFTNLPFDWAWTSTTMHGNPSQEDLSAAYMGHPNGGFARESKAQTHLVRLVRSHLRPAPLFFDGFES